MNITDRIRVRGLDDKNIVIEKKVDLKKPNKEGETFRWQTVSYHRNVNQALKSLVDKEINGMGMLEFKMVCAKVQELKDFINQFIKEDK